MSGQAREFKGKLARAHPVQCIDRPHPPLHALFCLLSVAYFGRNRIFAKLPDRARSFISGSISSGGGSTSLYSRLPAYDWSTSRLAGLHSTLFDIEANIEDGDSRTGLEAGGAQEIERLMNTQGVVSGVGKLALMSLSSCLLTSFRVQNFDTARLMVNQARFSKNNIDPRTGMPLDRKAVTFENLR